MKKSGLPSHESSRLVDWLRVPTPMWAIRVHAWVEVGGSVMELFHCRVKWNARNYFWRHLAWKAASKHLSEGELESTWPCSIQKYCRVQRNREFVPVQWEIGSHWPWSEIEAVSAVPHDNTELRQYRTQPGGCRWIPYIGSERKNSVRKTGERYKHRE